MPMVSFNNVDNQSNFYSSIVIALNKLENYSSYLITPGINLFTYQLFDIEEKYKYQKKQFETINNNNEISSIKY